MKISQLYEARRGGDELNPKTPVNKHISDHLKQAGNIGDVKNSFVSFTAVDKLGINPTSKYHTPLGIYAYPSQYVEKTAGDYQGMEALPFAGKKPFANIFSVSGNIINLTTLTQSELVSIYQSLAKVYHKQIGGEWKTAVDTLEDYIQDAPMDALFKSYPGGQLWYVTRQVASDLAKGKAAPTMWNKLFRLLGIDGCIDIDPATGHGVGIIHTSEPTQAVFFSTSPIQSVKRIHNKYAPDHTEKAKAKGKAADEVTKMTAKLNSMLDAGIMDAVSDNKALVDKLNKVSEPLAYEIVNMYPHSTLVHKHLLSLMGWIVSPRIAQMINHTSVLQNIKNLDDVAVQHAIVSNIGNNIRHMYNANVEVPKDIQIAAIKNTPSAFEHVAVAGGGSADPDVEKLAVTLNPDNIGHILHPSPELQMIAVSKLPTLINYIDNPTPQAQLAAYTKFTAMRIQVKVPPELQATIVAANPSAAKWITNLTPELKAQYLG